MSTNCYIGKYEGNKIKAIYCHWDGYPEGVGRMLQDCYTSEDKINKLLALGAISSLYEEVEPKEGQEHSFEKPAIGVTIAYHRDRGEDFSIDYFSDEDEFRREGLEYKYLWKDDTWYMSDGDEFTLF